ncbi:MAG: AsnC family transcriptional regulator [Sandaracinus sp.]|nr:AsnC family transcriptional regulator [Sandaracinus sp.]
MSETLAPSWTFLSRHAQALICIARDPDVRLRDIADLVGVTPRAAQQLVNELRDAGVVRAERRGRRNHYVLVHGHPLHHPLEAEHTVDELLSALAVPHECDGECDR